jgi:hypothetical protein
MTKLLRRVAFGTSGVLMALLCARPTPADPAKAWFLTKPPPVTQTMKPVSARGENPCNTDDPGFGAYQPWTKLSGSGQVLLPQRITLTGAGEFDLVVHFHGHEPARKEWVRVMKREIFVAMSLGERSGPYETAFTPADALSNLVAETERLVSERSGKPARARRIALSAWSAGYGAVEAILRTPYGKKRVDSVVLLDGLHCDYAEGGLDSAQMEPFVAFAKRAAAGERLMVVSHSSIIPPGYASTTETSNWLVMKLGGKPKGAKGKGAGPWGLQENARWDAGNFHMRGYDGNDKMDHCAHFALMKDVLKVHIKPRWNSPKGLGPKKETAKKESGRT